jgi:hypothetical protein
MNCILWKVKYKWWDMQSKLSTMKHKWVRSYAYLKFVWTKGDFDWDYGFLEELIRMKLKWMHQYHATHSLIDSHNRVTRQLWYALRLIELIDELDRDYRIETLHSNCARQQQLIDRLFKHTRTYYRGWWE